MGSFGYPLFTKSKQRYQAKSYRRFKNHVVNTSRYLSTKRIWNTIKDIQKDFIKQLWKEYEDVSLKAGVIEFLEKCYQEHQDVIIFTANDSLLTQHLCQRLHIDQFIKHIISCQDIGYDKTDSQSYQKVIEKYHLEDCIVIEDAYHALKSAKTAKLKTWAIYDKANQKEWKQICQIANQYFMTFYEMEVIK